MDNYTQAREYLAKVLPFSEDGFVSFHWLNPKAGGRACQSVEDIIRGLDYFTKGNLNFFACMASQLTASPMTSRFGNPYYLSQRSRHNAKAIKALWLDVDNKQYNSADDCLRDIARFLMETKFPLPSMIVDSGGGFHIYWTFVEHLTPIEWEPLAHALAEAARQHKLKADTQCTVDSVRILRIPDTLNHKYNPPRMTKIVRMGEDYFVQKLMDALLPYKVTSPKAEIVINLPPRTPLTEDVLSAGIENTYPLITLDNIAHVCPFINETVNTAGRDHNQPLWNMAILMSTFMEDSRKVAHSFSSGHPKYTVEDTDKMFDRKVEEQKRNKIGWPQCSTISGLVGAEICHSCSHVREGKSPFNFQKLKRANGHHFNTVTSPSNPQHLPPGYQHDNDQKVFKETVDTDGTVELKELASWPMYSAYMQMDETGSKLHFTTQLINNEEKMISIPMKSISTRDIRQCLQDYGCMLHDHQVKPMGEFYVSWIKELQKHKVIPNMKPLGWNEANGGLSGFSYAGKIWSKGGSTDAPPLDIATKSLYSVTGKMDPWRAASRLITEQARPELNIILASAFAAPLIKFTGLPAYLLSAYSLDSGIGKTTAMRVAQAVWGHPTKAMQSITDTYNAVTGKMGRTNSLPLYWDELRGLQNSRPITELLLQLTSGREKDRLDVHARAKVVQTWHTILVCASNESILNHVTSQSNTTAAAVYRIVEFPVAPGVIGQVSVAEALRITNKLEYNFGHAGLQYAQYLGANSEMVEEDITQTMEVLDTELNVRTGERYWLLNFTAMTIGAKYANQLGLTEIDEPMLKEFLLKNFETMRDDRVEQIIDLKSSNADLTRLINQFLSETSSRNILKTNIIYIAKAAPPLGTVRTIVSPQDAAHVQIGHEDCKITIDVDQLERWLGKGKHGAMAHTLVKEIEKHPGVKRRMGKIGIGTDKMGAQTALLDLDTSQIPELNIMG